MANLNIENMITNAIPMIPKHYELDIRVLAKDEKVFNWLEDAVYDGEAGEIVLKGTVGEEWIIPAKKLEKYVFMDGTPIAYEDLTSEYQHIQTADSSAVTWLVQVNTDITGEVTTERGDKLKVNCPINRKGQSVPHADGDWIACSDDNGKPTLDWGCWVVNGVVVENTYTSVN